MKLLAFGVTRDIIGQSESTRTLNASLTIEALKQQLYEEFPSLKELNSLAIAINEAYATDDAVVNNEDVVALIPPVSGG